MAFSIDIRQILEFYDAKNDSDKNQVSSITSLVGEDLGAALLKHYFESEGHKVEILSEIPKEKRETDKKKAKQLDRWILAEKTSKKYYQTEIKNWSSHSIVKYRLPSISPLDKVLEIAKVNFNGQWDTNTLNFRHHWVNKVLKKMKNPNSINENDVIQPLVCYWYPIAKPNSNALIPFFELSLGANEGKFKTVSLFSMSIYLRKLLFEEKEKIRIEAPNVETRLKALNKLFNAHN